MKSKLLAIVILLTLFLFSSCIPETPCPPHGVWISEEPRIMLYIKWEYRDVPRQFWLFSYLGFYEDIKVLAVFGQGSTFSLSPIDRMTEAFSLPHCSTIFAGEWRMSGNRIRVRPDEQWRELLGVHNIYFERLEEYEPLNLEEWFPHLTE